MNLFIIYIVIDDGLSGPSAELILSSTNTPTPLQFAAAQLKVAAAQLKAARSYYQLCGQK
jgi:hypothetical protein